MNKYMKKLAAGLLAFALMVMLLPAGVVVSFAASGKLSFSDPTVSVGDQILISAVLGWTVAQFLKTVIDMVINKSFNPERIFGSGGMPSSHSATVCALTTASGMKYGVGSFEFSISFILAMVVMYDKNAVT